MVEGKQIFNYTLNDGLAVAIFLRAKTLVISL